jgi:hypothetical protein
MKKEELEDLCFIVAIITENFFDKIYKRNGSIESYQIIKDISIEFFEKYKDINYWEEPDLIDVMFEDCCDWEDSICKYAQNYLKRKFI